MSRRPSAHASRDYQSVIQHDHQPTPSRQSFTSPDTAIGRAKMGFEHGATTAYVVRKTDGVRIYDGPVGVYLSYEEW